MPSRLLLAILPFAPLAPFVALGVVACDTHAIGVSECQEIEKARCSAARACPEGIDSDSAEAECERFSRDNCLHGLPVSALPRTSDVNACIADIKAAGACAAAKASKYAANCAGLTGTAAAKTSVCAIVETPENSSACAFLIPTATPAVDAGSSD